MDFGEYLGELIDGSEKLQISSLQRLSRLDGDQARALGGRWNDIDVRRRRRIVHELTELAEDNVDLDFDAVFMRGLGDDDSGVRLESVRGLWENETPELIDRLLQLLADDDNPAVRAEAALVLGRFVVLAEHKRVRERHFARIEKGLRGAVENPGEQQEVRARALESIGAHDSTWVRQSISEAYESGVHQLKVSAVHAMGRSCESRWLPLLIKELGSDEAELRYEAAVAVGMVGDESVIPNLVPLLEDEDEQARQAAMVSLGEVGGPEAREVLLRMLDSESKATRDAAAAALAEIDFEQDPLAFRIRD